MPEPKAWHLADEGQVHKLVIEYVEAVESAQFDLFDRFVKLDALYDSSFTGPDAERTRAIVSENVIASNVDTVYAVIAATEVRPRFLTDDGDWSMQRRASQLTHYAEGLAKLLDLDTFCRRAFKGAALKGTGLIKGYVDQFDQVRFERVLVDDIIVDDTETRAGTPRQLHQRMLVDAEALKSRFPKYETEIDRAVRGRGNSGPRLWADFRPIDRNEVVCLESWYLPVGEDQDHEAYQKGRHCITIDGCDLVDEEWHKPRFPFCVIKWSERESGWYGIGLAERIVGHQRVINKTNWQKDALLDQYARPTTYVRHADANMAVKTRGPLGTVAVVKGEIPVTVIPPAVSPEMNQRLIEAKSSAFEESGVSRMSAQSTKPAGLDSGVALREYRDATTQRFAQQEKAFEKLKLDATLLATDLCKDLGDKAPTVVRRSRWGPKKIKWADVDMDECRVQIVAANNLSRTPAGRSQMILEAAQSGIISQDAARRLMMPNSSLDFEHEMSLYTAAVEDVERCIEEIMDGAVLAPEPYQNLEMIVWRGQMSYLKASADGAPEEVLENLRQWIVQAAYLQGTKTDPAMQDIAATMPQPGVADSTLPPEMAGMMPGMMPPGVAPPIGPPGLAGAGLMPADLLH